jgi:hypothetical protein
VLYEAVRHSALWNVAGKVIPPLGFTRDSAQEVEVHCGTCWPPALLAVLQRQQDGWLVIPYRHLSRRAADATGEGPNEPRGRLLPATSPGPSDVPQQRWIKLRCPRCKREEPVRKRRLYGLADAALAAGESRTVLD